MTLVGRIAQWTYGAEWRTWLAHFGICFGIAFGSTLLSQRQTGAVAVGFYYLGREHIFEGGVYSRDRIMDAIGAVFGAVLGYALATELR